MTLISWHNSCNGGDRKRQDACKFFNFFIWRPRMQRVLVATVLSLVSLANTVNAAEEYGGWQAESTDVNRGAADLGELGLHTYNWNPRDLGRDIGRELERAGAGISDEMKELSDSVSSLDPAVALAELSDKASAQYHAERGENGNFEDCAIFVVGALAAIGSYGGPWTAALGGAAGAAGARLACRAWYP
jgi:hypothetical protein